MAFENIIRILCIIMDIAKKLQILVSSKTFILYRSLIGLEKLSSMGMEMKLEKWRGQWHKLRFC